MKKWLPVLLGVLFCASMVEAKYVYPKDVKTRTERIVDRRFRNYDNDGDGGFSLEEYEDYKKARTIDERRTERYKKRKGTYLSPEEVFKQMDSDGDGVVSNGEMLTYERSLLNAKDEISPMFRANAEGMRVSASEKENAAQVSEEVAEEKTNLNTAKPQEFDIFSIRTWYFNQQTAE